MEKESQQNLLRLATITCLILFMALFYQVAWQYPVVDAMPLIERLLDSQYLLNDFYTNTLADYSPRTHLAKIIVYASQTLDVHYTLVVAVANVIRIMLYGVALYFLFTALTTNKNTVLFAMTACTLSFLSVPFLPAWWPISFDFTPSNLASVFALFAWGLALRDRVGMALILCGIAAYFHPVIGLHSILIGLVLYFSKYDLNRFVELFKQPMVYVGATLFLSTFLYNYFGYEKLLESATFIKINAEFRHEHHFYFSHMDIEKWLFTGLFVFLSIGFMVWQKKNNIEDKYSKPIFIYAALLTILAYIFVELIPTRFMVSFIPLRGYPILIPIMVLLYARFAIHKFEKEDYFSTLVLLLPFLPYGGLGLTWYLLPDSNSAVLPMIVFIIAILTALITECFSVSKNPINKLISLIQPKQNLTLFVAPLAVGLLAISIIRFSFNIPTLENSNEVYRWINEHTQPNEVIIADINAAENQIIRLVSRRAVIISKDFPFNEKFYQEWYQRYLDVYGQREFARGHIDTLSEQQLKSITDKYNAQIIIRTVALKKPTFFTEIGRAQGDEAQAIIYRVSHSQGIQ